MKQALLAAREALKLAIETSYSESTNEQFNAAIAIIDSALAQPEQEPVAWWLTNGEVTTKQSIAAVHDYRNHDKAVPLYRAPVAQKEQP